MKTSNKLILIGTGCILIVILLSLIKGKPLVHNEHASSVAVIENLSVTEFTEIDIVNNIHVNFTQSGGSAFTVQTDSSAQKAISVRIMGKRLILDRNKDVEYNHPIDVQINAPMITRITLSEGASFHTADSLILDSLSVNSTSGSHLFIRGLIDSLFVETSAGSVANVEGISNKLTVRSLSGSRFNADSLCVAHCVAEATSGAIQNLSVSHSLDAIATSAAQVNYHGNPRLSRYEATDGGLLRKK